MLAMRHGIKNKFDTARDPDFIKDAQQVFFDRVFAEAEFGGDSAVRQAIGHQRDHLFFARREQRPPIGIDNPQRRHLRQGRQRVIRLPTVEPDLSAKNAIDALAQHGKRSLGKQENPFRTRPQGTKDDVAVVAFRQQDRCSFRIGNPQKPQQIVVR